MLRPLRQTEQVNIDYICPWTQEAGGILTYGSASGMTFAQYAYDPSGAKHIGIQLNDIAYVNFSREYWRQYFQMTEVPCGIVGVGVQGDFVTDWIHAVGTINTGDPAYAGPSGLFTNSPSFSGALVGKFLGPLESRPHVVTMRGLGFSREYIDPVTKALETENDPNNRVLVLSDGFIKVRLLGTVT
jgi:hypothetical protein